MEKEWLMRFPQANCALAHPDTQEWLVKDFKWQDIQIEPSALCDPNQVILCSKKRDKDYDILGGVVLEPTHHNGLN